jgi:hypothetical protein
VIASDSHGLEYAVKTLQELTIKERNILRKELWKRLEFMDVSYFVNKMEDFYNEIN